MRLEDVEVNLKLHYEIDDDIVEEVQSRNMTDEELVEEFIEPNESNIKHKVELRLHCLQRDYAYTLDVHAIKVSYPSIIVTFDIEMEENDYDTLQECKEMFISALKRELTHETYRIYAPYWKSKSLASIYVDFEMLDDVHMQ